MERGQAFSIEAIVASVLLLSGLLFALQVTAVTPLTASTSSQHIENQQAATTRGVLATASADDSLRRSVLLWDATDSNGDNRPEFYCAAARPYYTGTPRTGGDCGSGAYADVTPVSAFGDHLADAFDQAGFAYNVRVIYQTADGSATQRLRYVGDPSDNAVTVRSYLTLYDDDQLLRPDDGDADTLPEETGTKLENAGTNFFVSVDRYPSSPVYDVFRVEVTVWRQ